MVKISRLFILTILISLSNRIGAQELKVVRDFRLISEIEIEKSLFNDWKVSFSPVLKLEKNATRIDEVDFDLKVKYSPLKFLSLGTGYRLIMNHRKNGNYEQKHRFMGEIGLEYDIQRFELDYRFRYQNIDDDFFQAETDMLPENILRNRLQIRYDIPKSKLTPYLFTEFYGILEHELPFAYKIKMGSGLRYNLKKYGSLKAYYRVDRELNADYPFTYFILGISYSYEF